MAEHVLGMLHIGITVPDIEEGIDAPRGQSLEIAVFRHWAMRKTQQNVFGGRNPEVENGDIGRRFVARLALVVF